MEDMGKDDKARSEVDKAAQVREARSRLVAVCRDAYDALTSKRSLYWYREQWILYVHETFGRFDRKSGPKNQTRQNHIPATADTLRKASERGTHLAPETFGPLLTFLRYLTLLDSKRYLYLKRLYRDAFIELARARLALHGFFDDAERSVEDEQPVWVSGFYHLVEVHTAGGFPLSERTAIVKLQMTDGEILSGQGIGYGALEAMDAAVQGLLPKRLVTHYHFKVIGSGVGAYAQVTVSFTEDGVTFIGQRTYRDLVGAGGLALIDALNQRISRMRE